MLAYLFVIFAVAMRMPFMPHPWNFTPVAAALLYFGARASRRQLWIPFAMLAASDLVLNKFVYAYQFSWDQYISWSGMPPFSGWAPICVRTPACAK